MPTYTGTSLDIEDSSLEVTKAILTNNHLSLEWTEGSYTGGLRADSADGNLYEGTFTYHGWPDEVFHARLGRYRGANGVILLFGDWWEEGDTERTGWLIQLIPADE
jgi:hypothetical protein